MIEEMSLFYLKVKQQKSNEYSINSAGDAEEVVKEKQTSAHS